MEKAITRAKAAEEQLRTLQQLQPECAQQAGDDAASPAANEEGHEVSDEVGATSEETVGPQSGVWHGQPWAAVLTRFPLADAQTPDLQQGQNPLTVAGRGTTWGTW